MTWQLLASENLNAAKKLNGLSFRRASVSRSYYAAYSACTHALLASETAVDSGERQNPGHDQLQRMIKNGVKKLDVPHHVRARVVKSLRNLWRYRVSADYEPRAHISEMAAKECLREAGEVLSITLDWSQS